ncbi:MAG: hypothetical protein LBN38_05905, partial [Verrucomicrobiota bacterium]|nr:hypothetical protein [Verrucomicrobiota bacterium]
MTGGGQSRRSELSVVIPTMGRAFLIRTLASLAEADGFETLEVLVAGHIPAGRVAEALKDFCAAHP